MLEKMLLKLRFGKSHLKIGTTMQDELHRVAWQLTIHSSSCLNLTNKSVTLDDRVLMKKPFYIL